jgi:hypothetical protein
MTAPTAALVLATESGIPYNTPLARLAVPLGFLVFMGGPYLLLRSNLGTRRAYLVLGSTFFGLMMIFSLFWLFGAPGTPQYTGPTNLPGQVADEYRPIWVSFAEDSAVAQTEPYAALVADPDAFGEVPPEAAANVEQAITTTRDFFSTEEGGGQVAETWVVTDGPFYAVAANDRPVVRMTYSATYTEPDEEAGITDEDVGQPIPEGEDGARSFTAYAFFDAGAPWFPSVVFLVVSLAGFALHALLLYRDEQREHQEAQQVVEERERVPASA